MAMACRPSSYFFRVRAAFRAAALRAAGERRLAADFACAESAFDDAGRVLSRFSARCAALARFAEGRVCFAAARLAEAALLRVEAFALDGGGGSFTPARRAFDKPIAIACLVERAPCFPSRMCSISSWTNSPA